MFSRCFQVMRPATSTAASVTGGSDPNRNANAASAALPTMEPSETYRVAAVTPAKTISAPAVARGAMGRNAPAPVAAPLPPRKRSQIGCMWPSTATTAATLGNTNPPTVSRATHVAADPFAKSRTKAMTPAPLPTLRRTLVAPTLPLPTARTSTP